MKTIAFYLPQFHPTPENNRWWGEGFTEWTNVAKAKPRFGGHYQPHIPRDLGFYDLRVKETRESQVEMAKRFGIDAFCYYHYWFEGKRLLHRPLDDLLEWPDLDMPFCLCWANESWARNWTGEERKVLIQQRHSLEDDRNHIVFLEKFFRDPRYLKIEDRPVFIVYRTDLIPHAREMISCWRRHMEHAGFQGIHLIAVRNNFVKQTSADLLAMGFDGVCEFQPLVQDMPRPASYWRIRNRVARTLNRVFEAIAGEEASAVSISEIRDYRRMVDRAVSRYGSGYQGPIFPTIFPSWDNSPRRRDGARIIQNLDAGLFGRWAQAAMRHLHAYPEKERLLFVNAWNEWAEGCHLEPDHRMGTSFLEALRDARLEVFG